MTATPKVSETAADDSVAEIGPGRDHRARTQEQRVGEAGRDLLEVVRDHHERSLPLRQLAEHRHQRLASAEVEAGARLVEQEELGVGHEEPGDEHPLALALGEGGQLLTDVAGAPDPPEQGVRALVVGVGVGAPPGLEGGVDAGHHGVVGGERRPQALEDRTARQPDAPTGRPHVDGAVAVAEDGDRPARRRALEREEPEDRGLPGAVRAEHGPPLVAAPRSTSTSRRTTLPCSISPTPERSSAGPVSTAGSCPVPRSGRGTGREYGHPVRDVDAVVIGAGPNGLVAANLLADAGWRVLVLEAQAEPGGAVRSAELTHPGYVHDRFSAFYPLGVASPVIRALDLESYGLRWRRAPRGPGPPDGRRPLRGAVDRRGGDGARRSGSSRPATATRGAALARRVLAHRAGRCSTR